MKECGWKWRSDVALSCTLRHVQYERGATINRALLKCAAAFGVMLGGAFALPLFSKRLLSFETNLPAAAARSPVLTDARAGVEALLR